MSHVFISHSTTDNDFTKQLVDQLAAMDIESWVDFDGIHGGDRWPRRIQEQIEGCRAVIVVMTRAARDSEWVERETLLAMDLKKPLFIALAEDIPLPLHLINRQFTDCHTDVAAGIKKLASTVRRRLRAKPAPPKKPLPTKPTRNNFFQYIAQLPGGKQNAVVARELYRWSKQHADAVAFGGKVTPGFHARVNLGDETVTVFSVWAYARQPAVQVQFRFMSEHAPYDDRRMRLSTLHSLNRLMDGDHHLDDKADRQPTLPIPQAFDTAEELEIFKEIMAEIIENLRSV